MSEESEYRSVVRIFATTQSPDYRNPWQSCAPENSTGSGVVIGEGRILTGAHVVADATFLQVQKVDEPDKVIATVEAICHDCDLALLRVRDPAFMDGVDVEELGELPRLRDRVSVVGYPVGGEEISITEGVVSRIEVQRYSHSKRRLLAVTVDAAINSGNSGGPVFQDGKVAGIAFQTLQDAENIGEMVPTNLIRNFIAGVDAGRAPRVPSLGLIAQDLENPTLRRRAGLRGKTSGVLVVGIEEGGSSAGVLEVGDVLLSIAGYAIANNGTVRYAGRVRSSLVVVVGDHYVGDTLEVEIMRRGKRLKKTLELAPEVRLVPRSQYDTTPTYFVWGGIVFQPLSLDYLRTWTDWWDKAPPELLHHYYSGRRTEERLELIVLSEVLADALTVGYEDLGDLTVLTVNGRVPRDMRDFVAALDGAKGEVELVTSDDCLVVLDADEARKAGTRIRRRYRIAKDRSADLKPSAPKRAAGSAAKKRGSRKRAARRR